MFYSLILFFLIISNTSFAQTASEVLDFSKSSQWQSILYLEDEKPLVKGEYFYLYSKDDWSPHKELEATLDAFLNKKKHKTGPFAECVFMGRKNIILKKWPKLFKPSICSDYENWQKGLDAGELYLVFTSAYPNNPASMFGHTFFRFDRKKKGSDKTTKELLGYSFSYQARTNENENPFTYTLKGLTGGYFSYLEIKPHYLNVGIYNNSESRDLWDYKLKLSEEEKDLFLKHSWEISITGAFSYYFFDENCSTSLIRHLKVIRPNINYESIRELFVVPQVTLREIVKKFNSKIYQVTPSIKRKIEKSVVEFSRKQKQLFKKAKKEISGIENLNDPNVLDTLVDYWKWKNYKNKTNLSLEDKKLMYATYLQRSKLKHSEYKPKTFKLTEQRPEVGHKLSKLSFGKVGNQLVLGLRYGFHAFEDDERGNAKNSFIKFLDTNLYENKGKLRFKSDIVDILSLQNFYFELPQFSWRVTASYYSLNKEKYLKTLMGFGLKKQFYSNQLFSLITANIYRTADFITLHPGLNMGFKSDFARFDEYKLRLIIEYLGDSFKNTKGLYGLVQSSINLSRGNSMYRLFHRHNESESKLGADYSYYF